MDCWSKTITCLAGPCLVLVLVNSEAGRAAESRLSESIERAKRATLGIFRHAPGETAEATKAHFSMRGSGVHIGDGYILTARHAVKRQEGGNTVIPEHIMVLTEDLHELPASLKGANAFSDLALYRVRPSHSNLLREAASFGVGAVQPGDEVFTVGYPLGWGPAVGFGRVGNPNTFLRTVQSRLLQVDMPACSGNSGGGLFDTNGNLVGMVHAIIQTEGIQEERRCSRFAFAVPGPLVNRITTALIEGRRLGFSRLGIQLTTVMEGTRWYVAVSGVTGPAREAGVRKGDTLLSINGTAIRDAAQLKTYLIEHTAPGQRVALRVRRGQTERVLQVTLGGS